MPIPGFVHTSWTKIAASARQDLPYVVCAVLAIAAIWCHRYPAGIDLPQHANLFRLWADLSTGPLEYRSLYRVDAFTPYLLAYAVAYPLTLAFGALVAVKCLLTISALGTPLMMRRWLRGVGGHQELGLFGFLLAFDFQYQCGFLSQSLAMPLMFGYLAAFERQGTSPGWRAIFRASLLGAALFFCHGITFGVCMVTMASCLVLERESVRAWRRALHALPLAAIALLWLAVRKHQTTESPTFDWFATWERLVTLFSGPFVAFPSLPWAAVSLAAIVVLLLVTRPHLVLQARRLVPLVLSMTCFLYLPETMAATTVLASRFCVYVHAFTPAALEFRPTDWLRRQSARVAFGMVSAGLLLLNARLYGFNEELVGLRDLAVHMQPGADVRNLVPQTSPHSGVFGPMQFGQAPAWITAEHGGIIDNDSTKYYQIPLKRNNVPFPTHHRYIIARGDAQRAAATVAAKVGNARMIYESSPWLLFEDRFTEGGDFTVVRSAQSWKQLSIDRAVSGSPLAIAGVSYPHGLGSHAESFIRLRIDRPGRSFTGGCGIDDRERTRGKARFRIRDDSGEVLFESGEVLGGEPARRFSVILAGRKELLLEVSKVDSIHHAHADWVDLRVESAP
jgi:hypothetical protein